MSISETDDVLLSKWVGFFVSSFATARGIEMRLYPVITLLVQSSFHNNALFIVVVYMRPWLSPDRIELSNQTNEKSKRCSKRLQVNKYGTNQGN